MTIEEFDKMRFSAGMHTIINGQVRDVVSVNFDQRLIGLVDYTDVNEIDWYRCENIELSPAKSQLTELFKGLDITPKP